MIQKTPALLLVSKKVMQEFLADLNRPQGEQQQGAAAPGTHYRVLAPLPGPTGVELRRLGEGEEIAWNYRNFTLSPKAAFLPQREVLCAFHRSQVHNVEAPESPLLLLGVRPCDARALACLDRIFDNPADPYYLGRRKGSIIITLACADPGPECFCTLLGGGPDGKEGADLLGFDLGDELLLEAVSEAGGKLIEQMGGTAPDDSALNKVKEIGERSRAAMAGIQPLAPLGLDLENLKERLEQGSAGPRWEKLTSSCLGCGTCTYLCPTCHCFDITDEENGGGDGLRLRTWDSCQYPRFTLHASGHNPRPDRSRRLRQRVLHKFLYGLERNGDRLCVGCGRCLRHCPVGLDIRELLAGLAGG